MRHSRSASFDSALVSQAPRSGRWSEIASDPNDPQVLAFRARTLRAAWRDPVRDRMEFIVGRCEGRSVVDIGCVAHDVERMKSPNWLHGRIAGAAASCLGVDVLPEEAEHMRRAGYDVIVHDLTSGPGPVADRGPFDVMVAGELIEHVPSLDMLFASASRLLADDGQLIITTPNPWAPHRVAAGQRGDCWENADHIMFAFPSGIAELAERHRLVLTEAMTTTPDQTWPGGPKAVAQSIRRRIRGSNGVRAGFSTRGRARVVRIDTPRTLSSTRDADLVGETFVYVVRRPTSDS